MAHDYFAIDDHRIDGATARGQCKLLHRIGRREELRRLGAAHHDIGPLAHLDTADTVSHSRRPSGIDRLHFQHSGRCDCMADARRDLERPERGIADCAVARTIGSQRDGNSMVLEYRQSPWGLSTDAELEIGRRADDDLRAGLGDYIDVAILQHIDMDEAGIGAEQSDLM